MFILCHGGTWYCKIFINEILRWGFFFFFYSEQPYELLKGLQDVFRSGLGTVCVSVLGGNLYFYISQTKVLTTPETLTSYFFLQTYFRFVYLF